MLRSSFFWAASIWKLFRLRRHFVQQTGQTDCAVACALTVLDMMGRPADCVQAVERLDPDRAGTNLDQLRRYFEEEGGADAAALSVPADKITRIAGFAILHMRQMHYVVLLQASKRGVLVFDPSMGPVFYPPEDFASLYSGYLLQIKRRRDPRGRQVPARPAAPGIVGGRPRRGADTAALFVIGIAMRLLECALVMCLVAILYLVLNRASFPSLLMAFALVAGCGTILLVARQTRFDGEDGWIRRQQARVWRGLLRTSLRGRDLSGFRGRFEKDVSGAFRRGLIVMLPQRAQVPAALGAFVTVPVLLCLLSPVVAAAHLTLFALVMIVIQLDSVLVCRRSVRAGIGRYSKLSHGRDLLSAASAPDFFGEAAKWSVIGFAGLSVLLGSLSLVALMFWILTAMQIVPLDFRRAMVLAAAFGAREPVSGLMATEVPLRRQKVMGPVDLKVDRKKGLLRIEGIRPLTATLQQPDLTVREQRLILADVVRHTVANLDARHQPDIGPIRIFGPGQDATQADFEQLTIAREAVAEGTSLPVPRDGRQVIDLGLQDPILRALHSCEPGDFPVFWDLRSKMPLTELQARLGKAGMPRAGHLTMNRLTVVEAA